jgi:ribosomal protein L37E
MSFDTTFDSSWLILDGYISGESNSPQNQRNANILINVFPEWYAQVTLTWTIPPTWGNCLFHVYYTQGADSSYQRLTVDPISNPAFSDTKNQEYSKFREGAYVVEVILPNNSRTRSYPTSWSLKRRDKIEKIATEVQRREYLLLSKFAGSKSFLMRKKAYGVRCPRCWNQSLEKVMDDHCGVCYGTSWDGGYFDPIPLFVQYEQTSNNRIKTYMGNFEPNSITGWTISLPEISPDDVIIRGGDFNVYKVISNSPTELQTKTVRQVLSLTQFSKGDVENALTSRIESNTATDYIQDFPTSFVKERFPTNNLDNNLANDSKWETQKQTSDLPLYKI